MLAKQPRSTNRDDGDRVTVTGTGTMVPDGFPLGLVWFQDTSLVAVALLCYAGGIV